MTSQLHSYAAANIANSEILSSFIRTALALINEVEMVSFEQRLSLFSKQSQTDQLLKSINFGTKSLTDVVADLTETSTIIKSKSQESFIRRLFGFPVNLRLLYRASKDGFESTVFHSQCDNKGPTLCLFRSGKDKEKTFGGFSDKSWRNSLCFMASKESFLFSVTSEKKLRPFRNYERALFCSPKAGPSFGEDLLVGEKANEPKSCRSFLGRTYETFDGFYESIEAQQSLAGSPLFHLSEIEVYEVRLS